MSDRINSAHLSRRTFGALLAATGPAAAALAAQRNPAPAARGISGGLSRRRLPPSKKSAPVPPPRKSPEWGICLTQVARVLWSDVGRALSIGSSDGDCAPPPSHTTGHAVFRIRRLNPAALLRGKHRSEEGRVGEERR